MSDGALSDGEIHDGQVANSMPINLLDGDISFSFPALELSTIAIRPSTPQPNGLTPKINVPSVPAPAPARACQAARSRSSSIGQPRPASRRDADFESTSAPRSPPRRPRGSQPRRPRNPSLYPDYYRPCYPPGDQTFNRDRREDELFDEVPEEERRVALLVAQMTDMDVGRDDRYRGSGQRGGNKRRRDGELEAGSWELGAGQHNCDGLLTASQMRTTFIIPQPVVITAVDPSADATTKIAAPGGGTRSRRMRSCVA